MRCPVCGTENEANRKFCGECGSGLAQICPSCGTPNAPGTKFCGECGASLTGAARPEPVAARSGPAPAAPSSEPAAERRLVSVLFADLVGFTSLSETRDPEEVRELLTRYFDTCRTLIARYGGTVEKFIGDAVMAVWGTPVATEDDAERAVRAALELTAAVSELGNQVGARELDARAGVLTGEAAVTIGAEGQGMVAGDLVNTASRIQAAADPGSVLVGDGTRRATAESIVYEDAGEHALKGKTEPQQLWHAVRVVAGSRGILKSVGLEAPFVGRDRELRLIKDLFHSSAEEPKAHLVSVIGIAGLGKSRLVWEFFKYIDGLADVTYWHRGRSLAYGEGVTYWALSEMVKSRARVLEDDEPGPAAAKLRASVEEHIADPEERKWIEPRLAHLIGLEGHAVRGREELFSAWRLFFERMAERHPTVLVFEDLHWADPSLVDFIEHLLDWSRNNRIFVLTFARPELMDRFPGWGGGKRNFTSIALEPLFDDAMERMLSGLVPGLPDELRKRILGRAEGVPLYAVETVRMLLDRGLLVQEESVYRPTGPIETLEVPESLHALIASRLDGLTAEERALLQDAAVLGKTFSKQALAAVVGKPEEQVEPTLGALVRKEVLGVQADPRSPERGQYGFLQDLVRKVAHDTLSRRDRKARHLTVATYLEQSPDEEEAVEVIASHYLEAYREIPDADDAAEIKTKARQQLVRAGERASSFAATKEAQRYFEQAAELVEEPLDRAQLVERAADMAFTGGRLGEATTGYTQALALFETAGQMHPVARISARLGEIEGAEGRLEEGIERMERAFRVLSEDEPDADLATLAAQLGRLHFFRGNMDRASEVVDFALGVAEALVLPEVISQALNTKGIVALTAARPEEALALLTHALKVALDDDLPAAAIRAYTNLSETLNRRDRPDEAIEFYDMGIALARRAGNRYWERQLLSEKPYALFLVGRWDEALAVMSDLTELEAEGDVLGILTSLPEIHACRGAIEEARRLLDVYDAYRYSADTQERAVHDAAAAVVLEADGKHEEALEAARRAIDSRLIHGADNQTVKVGFSVAIDAVFAMDDLDGAEWLLEVVKGLRPVELSPSLRALALRCEARLSAVRGDAPNAEQRFKAAAGLLREIGVPFWLARTLLDHGTWLAETDRPADADPLLAEAREIFERLGAVVWIERVDAVAPPSVVGVER